MAAIYLLSFLLLLSQSYDVQSSNILFVSSMPAYSHFSIPFILAKEMASRGHQITFINVYPQKNKIENYEDVPIVENIPIVEELKKNLFESVDKGMIEQIQLMLDSATKLSNNTLRHENVQNLMNSNRKFDVVIIEHFVNDALVVLGYHFKAPVILLGTTALNSMNNYIFANPLELAYIPSTALNLPSEMNFWQRMQNLVSTLLLQAMFHALYLPTQRKIFKEIAPEADFDEVLYNTSLMFTNSHVSISHPAPLLPNIIEIGGFHVTTKPLPEDLQKYLDEAKEGVVVFSMGSNLNSKDLKPEIRSQILGALTKLKQKVLWKFEAQLPEAPENVKIMTWLPLQDVLAHPNVRAFITHGGRLSTIEAVYHGVPLVGIPIFGDQNANVADAVNEGYAVEVKFNELTEEKLDAALREVLENPKYRENVQYKSRLMHDRPMKPMDTAVYWVEHVIRHKGAPHLRSAGLKLRWYQRELLDVYFSLVAMLIVSMSVIYFIVRKVVRLLICKSCTRKICSKKEGKSKMN